MPGIDLSPEYVTYASSKNTDARVRFEVGDAQALRQPGASFDRTISLLVLNFVPDRSLQMSARAWAAKGTVLLR